MNGTETAAGINIYYRAHKENPRIPYGPIHHWVSLYDKNILAQGLPESSDKHLFFRSCLNELDFLIYV